VGGPGVEVVGGGDGTSGALALADGPVLGEGGGTGDGRSVGAGVLVDVVGGAVGVDGSHVGTGAWVVATEVLGDVVLNERTGGPSVDGEVGVAGGRPLTRVGDGAGGTGGPTLTGDEVVAVLPVDGVSTGVAVVVGDGATTGVPEGVVVATVGAGALCSGALDKTDFSGDWLSDWSGEGGDGGRGGDEESREVHVD